jgi:hypothetical protein
MADDTDMNGPAHPTTNAPPPQPGRLIFATEGVEDNPARQKSRTGTAPGVGPIEPSFELSVTEYPKVILNFSVLMQNIIPSEVSHTYDLVHPLG